MNYYWPIILIVGSNVCYHIAAKSVPGFINPLASLSVTYTVAAIISLVLYFFTNQGKSLIAEYANLNWSAIVLGIVIVGLEFGNICMYKAGWNISVGSLVANISLAVILVLIGLLLYKESLAIHQLMGLGFCIGGLILLNYK